MPLLTIGFSKPKGWFKPISWLIRAVNGTEASHTYAKMPSPSLDRTLIYQAHGPGVNFIGSKAFDQLVFVIKEFDIEITDAQKKLILQFCVDHAEEQYGRLQLFGILWVKFIFKIFGKKVKNPFPDGSVCTEVVTRLLQLLGIELDVDPDVADLNDVYSAVETFCRGSA